MPKSARPLIVPVGALLVVIAAGIVEVGCQNQSAAKSTAPPTAPAPTPAAAPSGAAAEPDVSTNINDYGEPMRSGADFPVPMAFARDTRTFKIAPLDGVEFNYRMEKGGTMVYSWTASDAVLWDFHGEPKGAKKAGYAESYATGESKEGNGGFLAPESGIHGWFWQNQGTKPVTVTLKTAGHYTEILLTMPDDSRAPQPMNPR